MPYITSTASCGTDYTLYKKSESGVVVPVKTVSIAGGANCANKLYITRQAVVTKITDDDLEMLRQNPEFVRHCEAGFLKVSKVSKEESNKGMTEEDASAPMTPAKYKKRGKKAPKTTVEEE